MARTTRPIGADEFSLSIDSSSATGRISRLRTPDPACVVARRPIGVDLHALVSTAPARTTTCPILENPLSSCCLVLIPECVHLSLSWTHYTTQLFG
jgi:hypothetical protein